VGQTIIFGRLSCVRPGESLTDHQERWSVPPVGHPNRFNPNSTTSGARSLRRRRWRCRGCFHNGFLRRRFLDRSLLDRGFLHRGFLDWRALLGCLRRCGFLGGAFRFGSFRPFQCPPLLGSLDDRPSASLTEPSFGLGCWLRRWLACLLGFGPSLSLCFGNRFPAGSADPPAFASCRFRRGLWFRGAGSEGSFQLAYGSVDAPLLFLKSNNGGSDDFV